MRNSSGPRDPDAELGERNDLAIPLGDEKVVVFQPGSALGLLGQRGWLVIRVEELAR